MLMHAIVDGDCTDTVRESALEAGYGRKIAFYTRDSNPIQYCTLASQSDNLPTELSPSRALRRL